MNMVVLLCVVALFSCAVCVLGIARVSKNRKGLKSYERACLQLSQEPPLSLPRLRQQQQHNTSSSTIKRSLAFVSESARATLLASLISPLLASLSASSRVEQDPSTSPHAEPPADAPDSKGIWEFVRQQPLVLSALRLSGLSLLMANQHDAPLQAAVVRMNPRKSELSPAEQERECQANKIQKESEMPLTSQTMWSEDDEDDDEMGEYDADSFDGDGEESDSTLQGDADNDDDLYKDTCEQEEQDDGEDIAAESDAQRMLFDGLQFYTVLSQVGATVVRSVVHQALQNTLESLAIQRVQEKQQASISAIEQRYPDILCLSAPSYMQHTTRADLATALLAVTAAAAAMQQQQQHAQLCSTIERRVSVKRPESLAPLTSPSTGSSTQLETSFLQAA